VEKHLLSIYEAELSTQCKLIVVGAQLLNSQLPQLPGPRQVPTEQDSASTINAIWFGLQGMLVAGASASKILWGSKSEDDVEKRRALREAVEVDESSPFYSRRLRNDFEHFDERIEDWFGRSAQRNYVGRSFGATAPNAIVLPEGYEQPPLFGNYDPPTATVTFWDRSVELNPLVDEAERVGGIVEKRFRSGP